MRVNVIKIPDTVKDMNLSHFPFFMALSELVQENKGDDEILEQMDPDEVADLVTMFFNTEPGSFDMYTKEANKKLLLEIVKSCSTYSKGDIKDSYTIDGVNYVWQRDYSEQPVSFHRDIKTADFKENPLELVAFCYVEEGMLYNDYNEKTKVIVNPRKKRAEAFKGHVSLQDFLDIQGFFLESYAVFRPFLKVREEAAETKRGGSGKTQSTT
jgi:hypothetical protein